MAAGVMITSLWLSSLLDNFWKLLQLPLWLGSAHSLAQSNDDTSGTLTLRDNRDGRIYNIPISHNAVNAVDLRQISVNGGSNPLSRWHNGLRVLDPGFQNTAVKTSSLTHM